jgi:hypothetical protein
MPVRLGMGPVRLLLDKDLETDTNKPHLIREKTSQLQV